MDSIGNQLQFMGGVPGSSPGYAYITLPDLKSRLAAAQKQAEERLAAVKEAREIFERNPDIERLLDLMQRSHF